jgi:hypothetical protein
MLQCTRAMHVCHSSVLCFKLYKRGRRGRDRMVVRFTTTFVITAYHHWSCEFESRTGEVYSIQHYVIQFVSDLRQVGGFLRVLRFPLSIKLTATIWLTWDVTWVPEKVIFRSVTVYNKNVSGQGKLSAQIEQVQNKMKYASIWLWP